MHIPSGWNMRLCTHDIKISHFSNYKHVCNDTCLYEEFSSPQIWGHSHFEPKLWGYMMFLWVYVALPSSHRREHGLLKIAPYIFVVDASQL